MVDADGHVLVQRRPAGKPMAGLWEFPGGKVELRETPEAALARELHEELGVRVSVDSLRPIAFASEGLGARHLLLLLYGTTEWQGEARPNHATALDWVAPERLTQLKMPPADGPLIPPLRRWIAGQ